MFGVLIEILESNILISIYVSLRISQLSPCQSELELGIGNVAEFPIPIPVIWNLELSSRPYRSARFTCSIQLPNRSLNTISRWRDWRVRWQAAWLILVARAIQQKRWVHSCKSVSMCMLISWRLTLKALSGQQSEQLISRQLPLGQDHLRMLLVCKRKISEKCSILLGRIHFPPK